MLRDIRKKSRNNRKWMSDRILLCRNGYGHHLPLALHPLDVSYGFWGPAGMA